MIVAFERKKRLNPFGTGQCLSTQLKGQELIFATVSIPLEQGSVFRHSEWANQQKVRSQSLWNRAASFDHIHIGRRRTVKSLNPFGTGQCLSTGIFDCIELVRNVSIPLEQGSVFRLSKVINLTQHALSQSLWNRAVSFDKIGVNNLIERCLSQSLWNRAVSFDQAKADSGLAESMVSIPLEQGSVFRR